MRKRTIVAKGVCVLTLACGAASAAELGDVNGDGRVSYADLLIFERCVTVGECGDFGPAVHEFADAFPCSRGGYPQRFMPELLYGEVLRRLVPDPLPHFVERWPAPAGPQAPAPPPDGRILVEVVPAVHSGGGSQLLLGVRVTAFVPIEGMHLVFKVDGLELAAPVPPTREPGAAFFSSAEYYLATRGLGAYRANLYPLLAAPAEEVFQLRVDLKKGTNAGLYRVDIVEAEAVLADWEVLRPETLSGTLEVVDPMTSGSDQPFPPLQLIDGERRQVVGDFEYRITDAEGFPGDEVSVKVQVRTERPVNFLPFALNFTGTGLRIESVTPLYADPITGLVKADDYNLTYFNVNPRIDALTWMWLRFHNNVGALGPYETDHDQSGLAYLSPLGVWVDLLEIRIAILPEAAGRGEVRFNMFHQANYYPVPMFVPFIAPVRLNGGDRSDCRVDGAMWEYEPTVFHPGKLRVLGPGEPPPPPPPPVAPEVANIVLAIGEVEAKPGDVVSLPIDLETAVELYQLRFVLGFDSSRLELEGLLARVIDGAGVLQDLLLTLEVYAFTSEVCQGEFPIRSCRGGFPLLGVLHDPPRAQVPSAVLIADLTTAYLFGVLGGKRSWEPGTLHDIGAVVFRVRDDAEPGVAEISGVEATWTPEFHPEPIRSVTSGYPILVGESPPRPDVPAFIVHPGRVTITEATHHFLRADSNRDGKLDLSDAVRTLGSLFQGDESLPCADAADANDDGRTDISDAIYTLAHLFTGGPAPPAPFPAVGEDPSADPLGCSR